MEIKRIIIEGPDCSGKSTIVDRIKNTLRWDSKSLHHFEGDQFERYLKEYSNNKNTVFDRSHFSEIVYSKLWRDGNPFSKNEEEILNKIAVEKSIIIFTCPDHETIKERYLKRNYGQQIKLNELERSREFFIEIMKNTPVLYYKSENYAELDSLLAKIKGMIK